MNIGQVHKNMDYRHENSNYKKNENRKAAPKKHIDAFVFQKGSSDKSCFVENDIEWLTHFVKNFPEEQLDFRLEKFREKYGSIDDCLTDKLIMEEL